MERIENGKDYLLTDSYVWILSHRDFIEWKDGETTRLLWIKGDPGKGKTMLLIGIIKKLSNIPPDSDLLSFFFCQASDINLDNATAVLRGLVYQMLVQQRILISQTHTSAEGTTTQDQSCSRVIMPSLLYPASLPIWCGTQD